MKYLVFVLLIFGMVGCLTVSGRNYFDVTDKAGNKYSCKVTVNVDDNGVQSESTCDFTFTKERKVYVCAIELINIDKKFSLNEDCSVTDLNMVQ